jgi:hypothetical protein
MDRVAELIMDRKLQEARDFWHTESLRLMSVLGAPRIEELDPVVSSAIHLPDRVVAAIEADIGRESTFTLRDGSRTYTRTLLVEMVEGYQVRGVSRQGAGEQRITFHVRELSLDEQLRRLKPENDPNPELSRGIVYLGFSQLALASASFRRAAHPLGDALLVAMDRRRAALAESFPWPERRLREWLPVRRSSRLEPQRPAGDERGAAN